MEEKKWNIIYFIMLIAIIVFSFVMGIMDAFYDNVIGFSIIGVFMLHFTSLHLQSRLIKQQNLGATLELLKLSKTPKVLNQ